MGDQVKFERILFVSGSGRSGTNIIKKIFAQSDEVATLPFEYRFTVDPLGVVDFINSYPSGWSPFWPDQKINQFLEFLRSMAQQTPAKKKAIARANSIDTTGLSLTHPSYAGWELEQWIPGYSRLIDALESQLVDFRYRGVWPGSMEGVEHNEMLFATYMSKNDLTPFLQDFLNQVTKSILNKQARGVFLEDNTYTILFANDILALYPNSVLLHVVRDPRDVLASARKQRWTPTEIPHLVAWYIQIMDRWQSQYSALDGDRVKIIRFEDLVTQKEKLIDEVCAFFQVESNERMISTDLSKHHIGRYKEDFNNNELGILNGELAPYLEMWGYE